MSPVRRVVLLLLLFLAAQLFGTSTPDEIVASNTKSYQYHCLTCSAAKRCTKNCIDIRRSEAKARGGVACKICGGMCDR